MTRRCLLKLMLQQQSTDQKCVAIYNIIKNSLSVKFQILSLQTPHHLAFGELNLED